MDRKTISKGQVEDAIALLLESRNEEVMDMPDSTLIIKYYTMALEDLYFDLFDKKLDLGDYLDELPIGEDF